MAMDKLRKTWQARALIRCRHDVAAADSMQVPAISSPAETGIGQQKSKSASLLRTLHISLNRTFCTHEKSTYQPVLRHIHALQNASEEGSRSILKCILSRQRLAVGLSSRMPWQAVTLAAPYLFFSTFAELAFRVVQHIRAVP